MAVPDLLRWVRDGKAPSQPEAQATREGAGGLRSSLADDVRQKAEIARALDGAGQLPLLFCAHRRNAARHDLSAFRDEPRQQPHVLVVDLGRAFPRKRAALAAPEKRPARLSLLLRHWLVPSVLVGALGAASSRGGRGLSRNPPRSPPRSKRRPPPPKPPRSPPKPPRSPPKPPRSPPKPPRSSSRSRERLCRTMAEGPSSSSSTRIVMKRMTSSLIDIWRSISATAAGGASMLSSE